MDVGARSKVYGSAGGVRGSELVLGTGADDARRESTEETGVTAGRSCCGSEPDAALPLTALSSEWVRCVRGGIGVPRRIGAGEGSIESRSPAVAE